MRTLLRWRGPLRCVDIGLHAGAGVIVRVPRNSRNLRDWLHMRDVVQGPRVALLRHIRLDLVTNLEGAFLMRGLINV